MASHECSASDDSLHADDSNHGVELGRYMDADLAHEHGLVILAMRAPYWLVPSDDGSCFRLLTEPNIAEQARREIADYEIEQSSTNPDDRLRDPWEHYDHGPAWSLCAFWVLSLMAVFILQKLEPSIVDQAASSSEGLIRHGEIWRPATALFLHADVPHLVGNLVSGSIFAVLLARSIGGWKAWLLILLCGTLANATVSFLVWPAEFRSIGASTAVFSALGILTGLAFQRMTRVPNLRHWARKAAPLLAGIVMLAWLGGGGVGSQSDVLGHACGFASGLIAGILWGRFVVQPRVRDR
ncbi:MAG: rhomboid family intramembrane serine protease [Luteolibacter sp.]